MNFRLLGPLEVEGSRGLIRIRGAKQRALLGLLLVRANQPVSNDLLIDELWGERPPATARHTLEVYVSRLRQALAAGGNGNVIESRPGGYRIRIKEDELDVLRFERLLAEGHSALDRGAFEQAEERLAAALGLWRGPALVDLAGGTSSEVEAQRLEELRLAALEARLEAALRLGRDAELVGELQSLVSERPLDERLRAQLMLALYRSGRQADALASYREGRDRLDELGIDPSRELQDLERAILRHDRSLDPAPSRGEGAQRPRTATVMFYEAMPAQTRGNEDLDPEALSSLGAFFGRAKATVESHGGTVDGVMGRAAMAVFGVPVAHQEDALRACKAAVAIRSELPPLRLYGRIGLSSGEVLADDSARWAIGKPVDEAARLQQVAGPGEVLIGDTTVELTRGSVQIEPVGPLVMGNGERVPAHRLLSPREKDASGPRDRRVERRPQKCPVSSQ